MFWSSNSSRELKMTETSQTASLSPSTRKRFLSTRLGRTTLVVGALAAIGAGAAYAGGWGPRGMGHGMGHGMGPGFGGLMGGPGFERLCAADVNFVTQRMADRMASRLNLTDAQKPALNDLRAAAIQAATEAKKSCGDKVDLSTAPARMALAQQRLSMAGQAMATIKPKFDAFYAALNDEQKKVIDQMGRHGGPHGPKHEREGWMGPGMGEHGMGDHGMGPGMKGHGMGGMGGMGGMQGRGPVAP
jgi:hypothetical protein